MVVPSSAASGTHSGLHISPHPPHDPIMQRMTGLNLCRVGPELGEGLAGSAAVAAKAAAVVPSSAPSGTHSGLHLSPQWRATPLAIPSCDA